jgi:HlyD family secretion protein
MKTSFLLLLPLFLLLAACSRDDGTYQGYAEGEYVRVAPVEGGIVDIIKVKRGDRVKKGALLFLLDAKAETAARDQAQAQLDDLTKGLRDSEMEALRATRANAAAALNVASLDLTRKQKLFADGFVSKAALDASRAARDQAEANVRQIDAQLKTGASSAREDQVKAARAALAQAEWRLSRRQGFAPKDALVEDTYFREGELAAPAQPIVSLLPPENIKVRFFIPEEAMGHLRIGDKVVFTCDGCKDEMSGVVRYISPQAEFTPPVIYSEQTQAKLVFMAEAWADANPERLHPGQPVLVRLVEGEK